MIGSTSLGAFEWGRNGVLRIGKQSSRNDRRPVVLGVAVGVPRVEPVEVGMLVCIIVRRECGFGTCKIALDGNRA